MSKRKLLLADDSVTIQKVVNLTFADEGIEVISVGDGDEAMAKVAEISPDLVMADVNMPGLNGYQICEQIRQNEGLRQTPVILLVGSFEPFDEDEARRVGADDFLTKPFQSIRQLVNKVTVLLNSSSVSHTGNGLDDTLEMEKPLTETPASETPQYHDSGDDDEMIQANQIAGFALDESQKFSTKTESSLEDNFVKTQPLTVEEIREFNLVESPEEQTEEKIDETESVSEEAVGKAESKTDEAAEDISDKEVESAIDEAETVQEEEMPLPEVASVLESDEDDLLELPPIELDFDEDEIAPAEPKVTEQASAVNFAETETVAKPTGSDQISSELIEAIANRVVEKLSDKAVKEVAWEVVPQMTELIVKKMAEEKLKE